MGAGAPAMILLDSGRTVERRHTDKVMQGTEIHIMVITSIMTERSELQVLPEVGPPELHL